MEIKILTKEHIHLIHQKSIEDFGGEPGYYNNTDGKIESILAHQFPIFGYEKYPDIFDKAAMLMYFLIKGHCFRDGNKRVGVDAAIIFLTINDFEDNMDDLEGYEKTMEIAALDTLDVDVDQYIKDLAKWLRERFVLRKGKRFIRRIKD